MSTTYEYEVQGPDEALTEIRNLTETILHGTDTEYVECADRLAELVEGLDHWLTRGGFLPDAWKVSGGRKPSI